MPLSHDRQFHAVKLSEFRKGGEIWRVVVLNGPNLSADINEMGDFEVLLSEWAADLGVQIEHFQSNHEGRVLEFIHRSSSTANGYLVNPGGLTHVGESLRHALKDTALPVVEVHCDNVELDHRSIFAPSVTSIFSGLRQSSYLGALVSLVLGLDDPDFLHPGGTSAINRSHGTPKSLFQ